MKLFKVIILLMIITQTLSGSQVESSHSKEATGAMNIPPLSVQLWSVRDLLKKDFNGTIERIAALGFKGVEFAGDYGPFKKDAAGLKAYLDGLGLKVSGVHIGFAQLKPEVAKENLSFFKALGVKYAIIPWDQRAWSSDGVESLVNELNSLVPVVEKYQMQIGFHNHEKEFNAYKDATFWDFIAQNTSSKVLLQLDVGWVRFAGKDPIEYIKKYSGRTLTTHFKIRTRDNVSPIIGDNGYLWDRLISASVNFGNTQWIVLEQEEYPGGMSSMDSVARSKAGLEKFFSQVR